MDDDDRRKGKVVTAVAAAEQLARAAQMHAHDQKGFSIWLSPFLCFFHCTCMNGKLR